MQVLGVAFSSLQGQGPHAPCTDRDRRARECMCAVNSGSALQPRGTGCFSLRKSKRLPGGGVLWNQARHKKGTDRGKAEVMKGWGCVLRSLKKLRSICKRPQGVFWKGFEAYEFGAWARELEWLQHNPVSPRVLQFRWRSVPRIKVSQELKSHFIRIWIRS